MRQRNEARRERLRAEWGTTSVKDFAEREGTSEGAIYRIARELGLHTKPRKYPPRLQMDHRAIRERTTKFPRSVISAKHSPRVLVDGNQNQKLGLKVTKGRWLGLPIYAVTLVERASCPTSCREWYECYGNSMHWARRHRLDAELIRRLDVELDMKAATHRRGFLVRLHTLGDFGQATADAVPYANFWARKMREHSGIHVFGFTAHDRDSAAGQAIMALNREFPERCRIRFSGTESDDGFGATVIANPKDSRHVTCPFETDHPKRPSNCGECGLCWSMKSTVEFVRH